MPKFNAFPKPSEHFPLSQSSQKNTSGSERQHGAGGSELN